MLHPRTPRRPAPTLRALCVVLSLLLGACRSTPAPSATDAASLANLDATIEELYAAFCFDPGEEPDWETQRRIYLEGATFVAALRPGRVPRGGDTEEFLSDFRDFATSDEYAASGFHERIVDTRVGVFGGVAHAFVLFEGHHPGQAQALTRGVDSLQLVHDGAGWRLVSFTTQYEGAEIRLPARL